MDPKWGSPRQCGWLAGQGFDSLPSLILAGTAGSQRHGPIQGDGRKSKTQLYNYIRKSKFVVQSRDLDFLLQATTREEAGRDRHLRLATMSLFLEMAKKIR